MGNFDTLEEVPYQVVNLGVQGYGSDQALLALKKHLPKFNAKIVVYTFIENHILRNGNYDRRMLVPTARFLGTKPQFILTNIKEKPCEVTRGTTFYRYQCLPEFGNPQRVQHIIQPPVEIGGWIRGGDNTRDYVRRVDYQRRCLNVVNNLAINKVPKCGQ